MWDFSKQARRATRLSWIRTEVLFLYMFHWIAIHFLIHYLPFNNFAVCYFFFITRALNTVAWIPLEWSLCVRWCIRSLEEFYYCDRTWCIVIFFNVNIRLSFCWESVFIMFHFRWVCGIIFLNRLTPSSKGKLMPKDPNVKRGFDDFFFLS